MHPECLDRFRSYLRVLASMEMDQRLRAKLDPSDLVQQTFFEAHRDLHRYTGKTDAELATWLRKILAHNLADAIRHYTTAARDVRLEQEMEASLEASSLRLEAWLAEQADTPSKQAERQEQLLQLIQAMSALPNDQRVALEMKHLQGHTVADISKQMEKSEAAVAGLLRRGLEQLRQLLHRTEPS